MATIKTAPKAPAKAPVAAPARPIPTAPARPAPRQAPPPSATQTAVATSVPQPEAPRRGPGRPPGSRNKPKEEASTIPATTTAPARPSVMAPRAAPLVGRLPPSAPANAVSPRPPPDNPAILAELEKLRMTVQEQNETIAKLQARDVNVRSFEDITEGADNGLRDDDWRLAWNGVQLTINHFSRDRAGNVQLHAERQPFDVVFGIPRMTDPGKHGTFARSMGQLGMWLQREDGTYELLDYVLSDTELNAIRADG